MASKIQVLPPITKEIPLRIYFIIHDAWTRTIGSHVVGAERKKKVYFLFSEATPNIISLQSKEIAKYLPTKRFIKIFLTIR